MPKILIIYSHSSHFGAIEGFSNVGFEVKRIFYGLSGDSKFHKIINIITGKLITKKRLLKRIYNRKLRDAIKNYNKGGYHFLLILKGHELTSKTEKFLKNKNIPVILWTTDSLARAPAQSSIADYSIKSFFQDGADLSVHPKGEWLPLGFEKTVFIHNSEKTIDILLLGNLKQPMYKTRRNYFYEVGKLGKLGFSIVFAGSNIDDELKKHFVKMGVSNLGTLQFNQYVDTIIKAKVIVNIHQDDGGKPLNPLFFAIPAVGGLQITDKRDYYEKWLVAETTYFPTEINNINEKISFLLKEKKVLEKKIVDEVRTLHSYEGRARKILRSYSQWSDSNEKSST